MERMSWSKRGMGLVIGGSLLVAMAALVITSIFHNYSLDVFWHLQTGKDWLENGLSPFADHYSFTYEGQTISGSPFMFQAMLYFIVSLFGLDTGFTVFRMLCFALILGLALLLLRQVKAHAMVYAVVFAIIAYLLQLRAFVRPELLSLAFSVMALMLYFRAEGGISVKHVMPMVLLMWVWSNYHTPIVGYVIFAGFFLDCAVRNYRARAAAEAWVRWFGWGLLVLAVGFLNPGFEHPAFGTFYFPADYKLLINEYLPPLPFSKYRSAGMVAVIAMTLLSLVLAFRQRKFGYLLIWAVLVYAALTMQRMVTPVGIVIALLGAKMISDRGFRDQLNRLGRTAERAFAGAGIAVLGALLYSISVLAFADLETGRSMDRHYPRALADYMLEHGKAGRIFNDYGIGGYLIYRLSAQNQVYIDGRTGILYPLQHLETFLLAYQSPDRLQAEYDKHGFQHIVTIDTPTKRALISNAGGFGLDFSDFRHALYSRGPTNFPLLGELLARPACWHPDRLGQLRDERQKMDEILPGDSPLYPFAGFVVGYGNATDGLAYLDASIEATEWSDEMRRFAGFRFLESGEYVIAANLFAGIGHRLPQDSLAAGIAMLAEGRPAVAVEILRELSVMPADRFNSAERAMFYNMVLEMRKIDSLATEDQEFLAKALAHLTTSEARAAPGDLRAGLLCPANGKAGES